MTDPDRFSKRLLGAHDNPVLQPLMEVNVTDYMMSIEAKFAKLHAFVNFNRDSGKRVDAYIEKLHAERPQDGKIVEQAFLHVEVERFDLCTTGVWQTSASAGSIDGLPA